MNNNILDYKDKSEIDKHKNNFYESKLINRNSLNKNDYKLFSINNIDNIFLCNIKNFVAFEGQQFYSRSNPLVNTALQLIDNISLKLEDSYLYKYYNDFQPKNYAEVYNLNSSNSLSKLESTNYFFPWLHEKPTNTFRAGLFGPKDISNVEHRVIRLKNIINNINKYDYLPSKNDIIEGYTLLKNDDYRFLITGGHHRIAVLTALHLNKNEQYEELLVKYEMNRSKVKIINEKDVINWVGVKNNYIIKNDALELFNSFFKI